MLRISKVNNFGNLKRRKKKYQKMEKFFFFNLLKKMKKYAIFSNSKKNGINNKNQILSLIC